MTDRYLCSACAAADGSEVVTCRIGGFAKCDKCYREVRVVWRVPKGEAER